MSVQPFTLQQAIDWDTEHIVQEIARLQNSLKHLEATQVQLQEYDELDADIQQVIRENAVVITSQTERIGILRLALERKGGAAAASAHYEPRADARIEAEVEPEEGEEGGVFL